MKTIFFEELNGLEKYRYLQNSVTPRPIALASTVDAEGNVNLAPFSFFNLMSSEPPVLVFSPVLRSRDAASKHTLDNVKIVSEVVIHMVDFEMVEQMSLCGCEYPKGVNEFAKAGFTAEKSLRVQPPRVAEALVAFECKVLEVIALGEKGGAGNLIVCEVICMHAADKVLNAQGMVDPEKTDFVSRSGGDWYVRSTEESMFTVPKPSTQLGVGVEAIPANVRAAGVLTGNEKGRLANIEELPHDEEIVIYGERHKGADFLELCKQHLALNEIKEAWLALSHLKAMKY